MPIDGSLVSVRSGRPGGDLGLEDAQLVDPPVVENFSVGKALVLSFLGVIYAGVVLVERLTSNTPVAGHSSLMIVILLVTGVQLLMRGIFGEYLWRNLDQSRGRPILVSILVHYTFERPMRSLIRNRLSSRPRPEETRAIAPKSDIEPSRRAA